VGEALQLAAYRVKAFGLPEKVEEALRRNIGPPDLEKLVTDDGPGNDREIKEYQKDKFDDKAGTGKKRQGLPPEQLFDK
jgi:hypothetical protein